MKTSPRFHITQIRRTMRILWYSSRSWTILIIVVVLVQAILPLLSLFIYKQILDYLQTTLSQPHTTFDAGPLARLIALAIAAALAEQFGASFSQVAQEAQSQEVSDTLSEEIQTKSAALDLNYFEDPASHDLLHRAQREASTRPTQLVSSLTTISYNGLALAGILIFLVSIHWIIGLLVVLAALPGIAVRLTFAERIFQWDKRRVALMRKAIHLDWMMTGAKNAKELRIFNLAGLFQQRFRAINAQLRQERLRLVLARTYGQFASEIGGTLAVYGALAVFAVQVAQGVISLSSLVITYQAFQRAQAFMGAIASEGGKLYENDLYLAVLHEFFDLQPLIRAPTAPVPVPTPMIQGIAFDNVTFCYPGSSRPSLKGVTFTIQAGQVVALVGENGSGKSTLVKLLCRFYDPDEGQITVDGIDYRAFDVAALRRQISVIFQDYLWYQLFDVHENIWLGDTERPLDYEETTAAARQSNADAFIQQLPKGYATILGKEFDNGVDLSVGQWQKIALARALYRDAQILVLDEPSSSLDPLAEAEVFDQFNAMSRQLGQRRAALLISHRLSNVKSADWIYVLEDGGILEQGTHDQLLARGGKYWQMFEAQAQHYR